MLMVLLYMKEAALEYPISAMQVNKDYGHLNVHVRSRCMLMMVIRVFDGSSISCY